MAECPGEQDYAYAIEDLEPEIGNIIDRGWEVGLHGGHTAYLNAQEMKIKKERLEKVTHQTGIGSTFSPLKLPDTRDYLSKAGFQYDATLGYADCAGFPKRNVPPFQALQP